MSWWRQPPVPVWWPRRPSRPRLPRRQASVHRLVELHVPAGILTVEQRGAMIKGITEVIVEALGQPLDPGKRLFVEIFETAEGGYGVNGQAFLPRPK
jgi:4-oxalocrotonate tautomerase